MKRGSLRLFAAVGLLGAGAAAACSDSTKPLVGSGQNYSLSFTGVRPPGVSGAMAVSNVLADSLVVTVGTDRLVITSVELVLREIELKRVTSVDCDSTADEDACEEFSLGPQLVSLALAPGVQTAVTAPIDSGTYSKVEFEIHKPGGDPEDVTFLAAHPDWPANTSIRVTGSFNGTAFTFTTPLDQEQEYVFNPPLVVDASGSNANLTIRLDVTTWFKVPSSGALINPATANVGGQNEGTVKENIKNSIEAFEDDDRDGDERDG